MAFTPFGNFGQHTDWNEDSAAKGYAIPILSTGDQGLNELYDSPNINSDNGAKQFASSFGTVLENNSSFGPLGSIAWGFSVTNGQVDVSTPRVASPSEQSTSLTIIGTENPTINIQY